MGFWLRDKIKTFSNVTDTDVQRLELPNSGILSAIQIRVATDRHATDRSTDAVVQHICQDIDKLEVVETGQKIIKSLDGTMCLANNLYDFKRPSFHQFREGASNENIQHFFLLFGRYIMDKEYGLDLSRHKDVRLEIAHSFLTTAGIGWTTSVTDFEIYIWRWIGEGMTPRGYFKTSEKYHYTGPDSSGEARKELPCLNPYRRIMIRNFITSKTIGGCLTELSLVVNDGAYKPFYGSPMRMAVADVLQHDLEVTFGGRIYLAPETQLGYTESFISYPEYALSHQMTDDPVPGHAMVGWSGGRIQFKERVATNHLSQLFVKGVGHQYVSTIPFDIPDVEESYFPTVDLSKLEVILNHAGSSEDVRIVLDELVKY